MKMKMKVKVMGTKDQVINWKWWGQMIKIYSDFTVFLNLQRCFKDQWCSGKLIMFKITSPEHSNKLCIVHCSLALQLDSADS